jgi:hypothetical protein
VEYAVGCFISVHFLRISFSFFLLFSHLISFWIWLFLSCFICVYRSVMHLHGVVTELLCMAKLMCFDSGHFSYFFVLDYFSSTFIMDMKL